MHPLYKPLDPFSCNDYTRTAHLSIMSVHAVVTFYTFLKPI